MPKTRGKSRRAAKEDEDEADTGSASAAPPAAKRTRRGRSASAKADDSAADTTDAGSAAASASQSAATVATAPAPAAAASTAPTRSGRWQWEGDAGRWTDYSKEHGDELTDALVAGQTVARLTVPNTTVELRVQFARMVQANARTGWERSVRCLDTSSGQPGIWSWKDEKGDWKSFAPDAGRLLEASYLQSMAQQSLDIGLFTYTVDLGQKFQQTNDSSGTSRDVRRECAGVTVTSADSTIAAASSSAAASSAAASSAVASSAAAPAASSASSAPSAKSASTKAKSTAAKSSAKSAGKSSGAEGGSTVKSRTFSGKAPVDDQCISMVSTAHVYSEGQDVFDCMLNQTNIANNNNKYYIIQLLELNASKNYYVWQRWGRVGMTGQNNLVSCHSLDDAKKVFTKKFSDKTKNAWELRNQFVKVPGKYDMVAIDYNATDDTVKKEEVDDDEVDGPAAEPAKKVDSKLDTRVQSLIELICDVKAMEETVIEMKYDTAKAPLGKLTKDQVAAGYSALKEIEACINRGDTGRNLVYACDDFYTRVPHVFGMRKPPLIDTLALVKAKMALLETLADIEVAMKILRSGVADHSEHPIDRHFRQLDCGLSPLDHQSPIFTMVEKYVRQTHGKTHSGYTLSVLDVFEMKKPGEAEKFTGSLGNRKLLWHGSRLSNWVGILSKGLRIAPPEAPVTGYMFGKGVYFADMCSKSANYCFATRTKNVGLMLCCDVALGAPRDLLAADYNAAKLPSGKNSVFAKGSVAPDPAEFDTLPDGCVVPFGRGKDTGVKNSSGYTLNYNEFIVYKTEQIKMRYLVKVKFNFK